MVERLVLVGGSVAATAFIERLRELDCFDPILVIDPDPDAPYDRPPLSKRYLFGADPDDIAVDWSNLGVEVLRAEALGVDIAASCVRVRAVADDTVSDIPFGRLVIATGALPARLPIEPPDTIVLRSAEDARRIRELASAGKNVVIVGAGAIGVELASSLVRAGLRVTLLDHASGPLERLLGGHLAAEATDWLSAAGVDCRWQAQVKAITAVDGGWRVDLVGSAPLQADLLISAVGSRPAVAWLAGSALLTEGALLVDRDGRVIVDGVPSDTLFAIGDVASRRTAGRLVRSESWTAARDQGARLAEHLIGVAHEPEAPSYFWTEIAGRKIQVVGDLPPGSRISLDVDDPERGALLYRVDHEAGPSWIGVNAQPRIARLRLGA